MNEKGLSSIVATLLLILFSVLAIVIISAFIVPFIKENLEEGSECLDYKDYFTFDDSFEFNCYERVGGNYSYEFSLLAASVSEEVEERIVGFKAGFRAEGDSIAFDVISEDEVNTTATPYIRMFDETQTRMSIPKRGEVKSYVFVSPALYKEITIAPILDNGRLCDVSDSLRVEGRVC